MNLKASAFGFAAVATLGLTSVFAAPQAHADDIGTTAIKAGNFKTLVKAVKAVGLAPTIMGKTKLTVFAPTDAAFAKLPKGTVENLLKPENKATLKKILTYHVLPGAVPAAKVLAMKSGASVKTVEGESLIIKHVGNKVMVMPSMGKSANVTKADIMADNGVIHVIDTVLIPPSVMKAMMAKPVKMKNTAMKSSMMKSKM